MASLLSYSLTNLNDVKESLGIASSVTTYDNLLIRKINQATRAIEGYCGRRFQATTYTNIEYDATRTDTLILRQRPVISFTSLDIRDAGLNDANFETLDSQFYFLDNAAGVIELNFNASGSWNRYRVTYTAGYQTIPEDLAEACVSLACFYYKNASGAQVGVNEVQEGSRRVKYGQNNNTMTFKNVTEQLGIDGIIDHYANFPVLADR